MTTAPTGAWWRDVTVALEAVLVLDDRLTEVGLLNGHDQPVHPMGLEEKRLVASQAARIATREVPDLATPRTLGAVSNVLHPVSLVSVPEDLAAAQERLATFLRPLTTYDAAYIGDPEISADSARQLTRQPGTLPVPGRRWHGGPLLEDHGVRVLLQPAGGGSRGAPAADPIPGCRLP